MRYTPNFRETTISRLLFITGTISAAASLFLTSLGVAVAHAADTETTSVGDNLTASWDPTAKTLTVSGHGQLDRDKWMSKTPATYNEPNSRFCGTVKDANGNAKPAEPQPVEIKFIPDPGTTIDFPQDSSFLFSHCDKASIDFPDTGINTGKVTTMSHMFYKATLANPNTSNWDTSKVTSMSGMFGATKAANPDTSKWNTSKVTTTNGMFHTAAVANPNTSNWNTENVTDMSAMFYKAPSANPDTAKWNTSKVTNMGVMFGATEAANPDTAKWDTSQVTNMSGMFRGAKVANPNTSNWNTSQVTNMSRMFKGAITANPNTSKWKTEQVTNLSGMFQNAKVANPDVSNWDTSQVTDLSDMFNGATAATPDVAKWDTSQVTKMESVFAAATAAKPDVSKWKANKVTNMHNMFAGASSIENLDVSGWDIRQVKVETIADVFATEGRTSVRIKGAALKRNISSWFKFIAGPYHIRNVDNGTVLNATPGDGQTVSAMLDSVKDKIVDKATYLIRPNETVKVTATPAQVWQGEALPVLDYRVDTAHSKDLLTGTLSADYGADTPAGQLAIKQGTLKLKDAVTGAYSLEFTAGILNVNARPEQPAAKVDTSKWTDNNHPGAKNCADRKVSQSRTITTTPHKWDSNKHEWVLDTANAKEKTESQSRNMTDQEIRICADSQPGNQPSVKSTEHSGKHPTVQPVPKIAPVKKTEPTQVAQLSTLPQTGTLVGQIALLACLLGAAGSIVCRLRRNTR
ncbi:MAG: BspA family leucine-rich repeat surface protein [Varibaculum cambriense]|uniref:BspA family leucine-rich repeat surface protein n=1 Tax=Varibaculum cambriense TaxID=184870 RepID=UPI0029093D85|nr:BspA family leucine-rich repeat surface protein [Varibaculum cambriense]MDU6681909.1 BspA family leucine-rich repeat surface protein [Varibaculum cambriense]